MIEELVVQAKRKLPLVEEKKKTRTGTTPKILPLLKIMDHLELSLGPLLSPFADSTNSSSSESEASNGRKRKRSSRQQPSTQTSIVLQLNNPIPLDWEQCLDLQSGKMYYINRKTLKKSWLKPKGPKLDVDLNISNLPDSEIKDSSLTAEETKNQSSCTNGGDSMVAIVCLNCHLLVMLYRSSPSCPNCKYMHLLLPSPAPKKMEAVKCLETLSLLH